VSKDFDRIIEDMIRYGDSPRQRYRQNWPWLEVKADPTMPPNEIAMVQGGVEVARIINIGPNPDSEGGEID
jgi:hypothetical protein